MSDGREQSEVGPTAQAPRPLGRFVSFLRWAENNAADLLQIAMLSISFAVVLLSWRPIVVPVVTPLMRTFGGKVIAVLGIFGIGAGLATLKRRRPTTYGVLEVAFALTYAWRTLGPGAEYTRADTVALVGSVYLVVRGLTNLREGQERAAQLRAASVSSEP